jgi:hypothetical protein
MEVFIEFLFELIFRRIIVGFFGYYTLLLVYKILGLKEEITKLQFRTKSRGEEFGKGCLIGIVGLISFTLTFILIGKIYDWIFLY